MNFSYFVFRHHQFFFVLVWIFSTNKSLFDLKTGDWYNGIRKEGRKLILINLQLLQGLEVDAFNLNGLVQYDVLD